MSKSTYEEELKWFKDNEKPEPVLLVANSPQNVRIVVAWMNTSTRRARELSKHPGASETARWEWLWQNTRYSREELIAKSAMSEEELDRKFAALVGSRAVYPDGTVNAFVRRYLREKVLKLFGATGTRGGKR